MKLIKPAKIFISYSRKDEEYKQGLLKHLKILQDANFCTLWDDSMNNLGSQWDENTKIILMESNIVLCLVSPDSLNSEYIKKHEIQPTLERSKNDEVVIIPIIVHPCEWKESEMKNFQAAPKNGKAISLWENKDEAYDDINKRIKRLINEASKDYIYNGKFKVRPYSETAKVISKFSDELFIAIEKILSMNEKYWVNLGCKPPKWTESFAIIYTSAQLSKIQDIKKEIEQLDISMVTYKKDVEKVTLKIDNLVSNLKNLLLESESTHSLLYGRVLMVQKRIEKTKTILIKKFQQSVEINKRIKIESISPLQYDLTLMEAELKKIQQISIEATSN